mgnify:CR=1 FL=1
MKIQNIARAGLVVVSLALGSVGVANADVPVSSEVSTGVVVYTTINSADRAAIDAVSTAKANYQAALTSFQGLTAGSKEAKKAFKVALKAWEKIGKAQQRAKQQIGRTFKQSVSSAKQAYRAAVSSATTVSGKAEAKAARDAAIASASVARNDALTLIKEKVAKPKLAKK